MDVDCSVKFDSNDSDFDDNFNEIRRSQQLQV